MHTHAHTNIKYILSHLLTHSFTHTFNLGLLFFCHNTSILQKKYGSDKLIKSKIGYGQLMKKKNVYTPINNNIAMLVKKILINFIFFFVLWLLFFVCSTFLLLLYQNDYMFMRSINTFMKLADVFIQTGELVCSKEFYVIWNRLLFIIIVSIVNCGGGNSK